MMTGMSGMGLKYASSKPSARPVTGRTWNQTGKRRDSSRWNDNRSCRWIYEWNPEAETSGEYGSGKGYQDPGIFKEYKKISSTKCTDRI